MPAWFWSCGDTDGRKCVAGVRGDRNAARCARDDQSSEPAQRDVQGAKRNKLLQVTDSEDAAGN